jgi:hypothetical protein
MKNKGVVIFLIFLAIVIIVVIVVDFSSTRPDKQPKNPYEYSVDEFKSVDPSLILYKETKNFKLNLAEPGGLAYKNNILYVAGNQVLMALQKDGVLLFQIAIESMPTCLAVGENQIVIAFKNYISTYSLKGEKIKDWAKFDTNSVITSLAVLGNEVYVADAGKRMVYIYTSNGLKISGFEGKHEEEALHGFIIPSPYFDLALNPDGDLWVVNPGNHSLENYTKDGRMREFWKQSSMKIEGFSGCCNPAQFTFLPDGSFVTSEKGLVRIKIYKPSGEFKGVVAAPDKFTDDGHAPEVIADESGNIYALDFDKKMIRLFEPK